MQVSVADARNRLPELIRAVESGERVTVCRRGVPVIDLIRTKSGKRRAPRFGTLRGKVTIHNPDWWKPMSDAEVDAFLKGKY